MILLLAGVAFADQIYPTASTTNTIGWNVPFKKQTYHIESVGGGEMVVALDDTLAQNVNNPYTRVFFSTKPDYRVITIADLEGWLKYCYDDSTLVKQTVSWNDPDRLTEMLSEPGVEIIHHYKMVWRHKDPLDLNGLLQWLRKEK